jgi:hypothetical protein
MFPFMLAGGQRPTMMVVAMLMRGVPAALGGVAMAGACIGVIMLREMPLIHVMRPRFRRIIDAVLEAMIRHGPQRDANGGNHPSTHP